MEETSSSSSNVNHLPSNEKERKGRNAVPLGCMYGYPKWFWDREGAAAIMSSSSRDLHEQQRHTRAPPPPPPLSPTFSARSSSSSTDESQKTNPWSKEFPHTSFFSRAHNRAYDHLPSFLPTIQAQAREEKHSSSLPFRLFSFCTVL